MILFISRVNPKDTFYTGTCDDGNSLKNLLEKQPSFCYCDSSEKCGDGYDLAVCPFLERGDLYLPFYSCED